MDIYLYNTESRTKEKLKPIKEGEIKMYTCGPTVYNFAHIGNFRCYTFEDLLRRTLRYFGYKVTQAMNLTDVDDKTIRGAIAQNVSLDEYTKPFIKAFFDDLQSLRIEKVEYYPAATDYIPDMIEMIKKLLSKGMAYFGGDKSVYFPIKQFQRYGCLSHLHLDELVAGASQRVEADEYEKDNISDFVLWKHYDKERDGQIFWESPFGPGRPGWHLECSAMAMKLLGDTIDIHCGGTDNMFPHHENEIAQSEACSGKRFVNLWMHCEHLVVDNKKMSKSAGNFYTQRDILAKGYTGRELRYMLLQAHYKTQLNFTFVGLDGVRSTLNRLSAFIRRLQEIAKTQNIGTQGSFLQKLKHAKAEFDRALADDLNISAALGALFDLVRDGNAACDQAQMHPEDAKQTLELLTQFDQVLAVMDELKQEELVPEHLTQLLEERKLARQNKDWARSDAIRDEITAQGYAIEDTPLGARLVKKEVPV